MLEAKAKDNPETGVPKYSGLSGRNLSLAVSIVATNGFLLFGYDQGVMSGIISAEPFNNAFPQTKDNSTWQAFVTAIYEVGCLFGAIFQLAVGDKIGRRRSIILGGIIMILGVIIQITAIPGKSATAQFIIGRTITGIGNGINTSTIPTYQAECSKTSNRGLLICIEGATIAFGTLIAYWIDYGAHFGPPDLTWRFPIAFQIVFGLFLSVAMVWLPESPRWLMMKERHEEATTVLAALADQPRDSEEIQLQFSVISDSIRASGNSGGYSALLQGGKSQHFRRMLLGVSSQFFQQIGGPNAVIYYLPVLFKQSVFPQKENKENLSLLLGGANQIVYAAFAITSWFFIERVGRRKLFLIGSVGQCLSMVLVFACLIPQALKGKEDPTAQNAAKGAAVGLFTYIAFFGATWLPLPWLYPAEINPVKTRAKANAVSTCSNWLWNFAVVMFTPPMISAIGWGTYLFFAICNACFIPVIYFFYPETAGRSLEEIDIIFAKGYEENISYVKAAKQLPKIEDNQVERVGHEYGLGLGADDDSNRDVEKEGSKDGAESSNS